MKKIFIAVIIILFAGSASAQTAAPKELTCTEEAFNFNISLGSKWRLSTPKMGPPEIIKDDPGFIPGWSFKVSHGASEPAAQSLFKKMLNTGNSLYTKQNYISVSSPYSLKIADKLKNLFPARPSVGIYGTQLFDFNAGSVNNANQHL
jgi:hypothetical protein